MKSVSCWYFLLGVLFEHAVCHHFFSSLKSNAIHVAKYQTNMLVRGPVPNTDKRKCISFTCQTEWKIAFDFVECLVKPRPNAKELFGQLLKVFHLKYNVCQFGHQTNMCLIIFPCNKQKRFLKSF